MNVADRYNYYNLIGRFSDTEERWHTHGVSLFHYYMMSYPSVWVMNICIDLTKQVLRLQSEKDLGTTTIGQQLCIIVKHNITCAVCINQRTF